MLFFSRICHPIFAERHNTLIEHLKIPHTFFLLNPNITNTTRPKIEEGD